MTRSPEEEGMLERAAEEILRDDFKHVTHREREAVRLAKHYTESDPCERISQADAHVVVPLLARALLAAVAERDRWRFVAEDHAEVIYLTSVAVSGEFGPTQKRGIPIVERVASLRSDLARVQVERDEALVDGHRYDFLCGCVDCEETRKPAASLRAERDSLAQRTREQDSFIVAVTLERDSLAGKVQEMREALTVELEVHFRSIKEDWQGGPDTEQCSCGCGWPCEYETRLRAALAPKEGE